MATAELLAKQRMLALWTALGDAPATLVTTDHTVVRAASLRANGSQTLFAATQLQTPLGTYPSAVVRASDLLHIDAALAADQLHKLLRSTEA